jgi:hypothetical protein
MLCCCLTRLFSVYSESEKIDFFEGLGLMLHMKLRSVLSARSGFSSIICWLNTAFAGGNLFFGEPLGDEYGDYCILIVLILT